MVFFYHDLPSSPQSPTVPMTLGRVRRRDRCERHNAAVPFHYAALIELTRISANDPKRTSDGLRCQVNAAGSPIGSVKADMITRTSILP